jgi:hypothetical protein
MKTNKQRSIWAWVISLIASRKLLFTKSAILDLR